MASHQTQILARIDDYAFVWNFMIVRINICAAES